MNEPKKLHVAFFPWLAFGHILPYLELAKLMAERGHRISFISTPRNVQRLPKISPNLAPRIHFVSLGLPPVEHLPHDAEATMDIPAHKVPYLLSAFDGLQGPLRQFLETSSPDWIIHDFAHYWIPPISANLGISSAFYSIYNAWTITFVGSSSSAMIKDDDPRTRPEDFTIHPRWIPFPSKIALRPHEGKKFIGHFDDVKGSGVSHLFRIGSVISGCDVIAAWSCLELEPDHLRLIKELHGKPTLPTGLLPPWSQDSKEAEDDDTCWLTISEWLDKQNKGSVVYVAFGSEVDVSPQELNELALGLELSGLPFFWVLRKKNDSSVELPDGFEERVKGRGIVWTSWVPQLKIVAHESVGGFFIHCGTSSIIEALHFGHVLIMLPISPDQGLNARAYEEMKVGVEVTRDEQDGSFSMESVAESIKLVMVDEEGKIYRDNAKEMRKLFADKDLHDRYIDQFIDFLQGHRVAYTT